MPATERRQQIDRARADGARVWILQDNSALRKLRCKLVKGGRLFPFLSWLILDFCNFVERQELLTLHRQSHRAGNFLSGPQIVLLNQCARHGHILRNRQKIQFRPAQHRERIAHLIEKSFRRNNCATRYCRAHDIQNVLMPRAGGM